MFGSTDDFVKPACKKVKMKKQQTTTILAISYRQVKFGLAYYPVPNET
jgi:hypothetical protein